MKLPVLYSRRSDGAVQEWTIQVLKGCYRTISGLVDGEKVTSNWTVCHGKNVGRANETTASEQALREAEAAWTKKRERGYRESVKDIDKLDYLEPMLAHKYEDYQEDLEFPVWAQPKLDGIRCVATKKGLYTRNGKRIVSVPHIEQALGTIFELFPDVVFDGELYANELSANFNRIASLVRKTKPTGQDLDDSAREIQYWIYDCPQPGSFTQRWDRTLALIGKADSPYLKALDTQLVKSREKLDLLYEKFLEKGYEGQIVRVDGSYEYKRSKNLLKRKEFKDEEFKILDVEEGVGNRSGMAGHFVLQDKRGKVFHSNIKGAREVLREYLQRRGELQGKMATVQFFDYTPDGIPRFPFVLTIRDYE